MKNKNFPRREWWLDDQRTHRPKKRGVISMVEINLAQQHGFDADISHFSISPYHLESIMHGHGSKQMDWMLVVDRPYDTTKYFEGQRLLVVTFDPYFGCASTIQLVEYRKHRTPILMDWQVYVLKSDYDWMRASDEQCNIEDLI